MIHAVSLGWLILPPLLAIASALLWYRSRLWGLIPVTLALVLVSCFVLSSSLSAPETLPAAGAEEIMQYQFVAQFNVGLLLLVGGVGIIWQCARDISRRQKEGDSA